MGFFTGRVTFLRYRVDGPAPGLFGPDHLERLSAHAIGKQLTESKDGKEVGWIAGEDILDVSFDLAKSVVQDRFLRRKAYPVLWDGPSNHLFAGTTSTTVLDRLPGSCWSARWPASSNVIPQPNVSLNNF
jgi:hypothetical protein